ncbi:arginase [Methyloterricola oryzae]|uniref:arginase n=1 Tax=Methyloterricola oryzae TaxID=1495050 RepID=UPI000B1B4337|nr:arginase [Methyloterricola oryzae]
MNQVSFDQLYAAVSALPKVRGFVLAHMLALPEPLPGLMTRLMRQGRGGAIAASELAAHFGFVEGQAQALIELLAEKGFLYAPSAETGDADYRIRFGHKPGAEWPEALRTALIQSKAVQLIEVRSDLGAGTRGADLGPAALQAAAFQLDRFAVSSGPAEVVEADSKQTSCDDSPFAKNLAGLLVLFQAVATAVAATVEAGRFPIVVSGDHSTATGTLAGLKQALPETRLGVVWIDAHADIHSPYTTPSGNMHGMPLAAALGEDNLPARINALSAETAAGWNAVKRLGGIEPKIRFEDLVYVAVRDTEPAEDRLIEQHRIRNFTTTELRSRGAARIAREALALLDACERIYVSFDVDSMDPSVANATGTPVAGGLTELEAGDLIASLLQDRRICCFEICEINPTLAEDNRTVENALDVVSRVKGRVSAEYN